MDPTRNNIEIISHFGALEENQNQNHGRSKFSNHSKNISNFISNKMRLENYSPQIREDSYRNRSHEFENQKQINERRRNIDGEQKKNSPQYDFGGISYLPVKTTKTQYRSNSRQNTWNAVDVKQALLEWCKTKVAGYKNVRIDNFSSSWSDGLAFCALIHSFFPHSFDFNSLNPSDRRFNFSLAFGFAERLANIPALLDVDDMVSLQTPDWKSVFTYLQAFYVAFRNYPNH